MARALRTAGRRTVGVLAIVVVWAVVIEGALQLACLIPAVRALVTGAGPQPLIPDQRLGLRGNAAYPDHDEWGYRNPARPARAEVVALGDSQTYGTGVRRDEAWPPALERRLGVNVYNMGNPNFGAPHYWLELEHALSLEPHVVLVTVYFGNDFYDAFRLAAINAEVGAFVDGEVLDRAQALEAQAPLATIGQTLFEPTVGERRELGTVRRLLSQYSRSYSLASTLSRRLSERARLPQVESREFASTWRSLTAERRALASAYDGDDWRTILTPLYRREVVDYRDPRIEAGLAVIRASLAHITERCQEAGVRLIVVFIPTKENVFAGRIHHLEAHAPLPQLVADEEALKQTLVEDLEALDVEYVDLLGPLRGAPAQPYFEDLDGHPSVAGHEAIATEIDRILKEDLLTARRR
jgi:hypothetical protein